MMMRLSFPSVAAAAAILLLCVCIIDVADATPAYQLRFPNGDKVMHEGSAWPAVGHGAPQGSPTLNPFGIDFMEAQHTWTVALCQMDSDGDGLTNGQELGDPDCIWAPGQTPTRTTNISHPGFTTTVVVADDEGDEEVTEVDAAPVGDAAPAVQQLALPSWLVIHIALMMASWGFLLPLGALLAISFRGNLGAGPKGGKPLWFKLHIVCQILGIGFMIGGFVVAYQNIVTHFNNTHKTFGVAVVAIGIVQFLMGFVRPHKPEDGEEKTTLRTVWEVLHKYLFGRVVIILAWVNIFLGVKLVKNFFVGLDGNPIPGTDNIYRGMNIVLGLQAGLCFVLTATSIFYKSTPSPSSSSPPAVVKGGDSSSEEMNDTTHAFSVDQSRAKKDSGSDEEV